MSSFGSPGLKRPRRKRSERMRSRDGDQDSDGYASISPLRVHLTHDPQDPHLGSITGPKLKTLEVLSQFISKIESTHKQVKPKLASSS